MSLNIQLEDGYKQVAGNSGSAGGSILYYDTKTEFPEVGKAEKLYVDKSTGEIFTWNVGLTKYVVSGNIATAAGISYDNASSGLTAEVVQDAIDETVAKINDVQLFKFPNATIIGAPTINNGQVSGFSALNYMKFPFIVNMQGRPFTIDIAFTTGTDITNQQNIIDGIDHGIAFAIRSSKFIIVLGSKTGEWDISGGEKISSVTVQPQTTYLVRISWDGSVYKFEYSTNGESYTEDATMRVTSSLSLYPTQINIGVTSGLGGIFTGIINMNYCSLTISNKVVWTGMDDVGLATRMAVDMSNIDDAGVEKVKSIIGDLPTKESLELDNVTNDKQVKGLLSGTTTGHIVTWGADGYTVDDSGATIISTDINIEANKDNVPTAGAVKIAIETATIGMQKCLGTVNALTELSTTAKTGEYYRVKTGWKDEDADVHICDVLIAEKDNPEQKIDGVNWSLLHNEMDTNTTYTLTQDEVDGHKLTFESSDGTSETIIIPDNNTEYTAKANDAIQLSGTEFSHKTGNGYNHIPTAGAAGNVLRNNGSGSVAWEAVDDTPTEGSDKLITSGGVKTELDKKANKALIEAVDSTTNVVTVPENVLGFAAISKISGKTQRIIQLVGSSKYESNNCKISTDSSEKITVTTNGSTTAIIYSQLRNKSGTAYAKAIKDHWYYVKVFGFIPNENMFVYNDSAGIYLSNQTSIVAQSTDNKNFFLRIALGQTINATIQIMILDLTAMGIESRDKTELDLMFPDYIPYTEGELWNAPVEKVVSCGRNILEVILKRNINSETGVIEENKSNRSASGLIKVDLIHNDVYFGRVNNGIDSYVSYYDKNKVYLGRSNAYVGNILLKSKYNIAQHGSNVVDASKYMSEIGYVGITYYSEIKSDISAAKLYLVEIPKDSTPPDYSPYNKTTIPIPQEILNLPDYGIEGNYVDFENMKYYHNRTKIMFGDLLWQYDSSNAVFFSGSLNPKRARLGTEGICSTYDVIHGDLPKLKENNKSILIGATSISETRTVFIHDTAHTDALDFKNANIDTELIYELAIPEVIDISSILAPFKVEEGGTIALVNEHELDLPNTILYKKEVL